MTRLSEELGDIFDRQDVEKILDRILASEHFSGAMQLSAFLKYIVTKKLDGQESDIKAYSIAVDALGRDESFDPQENATVRVSAGRLRQVLALYNSSEDARSDKLRINLQPGSYVPSFTNIQAPASTKPEADFDKTLSDAQDAKDEDELDEPLALPKIVTGQLPPIELTRYGVLDPMCGKH